MRVVVIGAGVIGLTTAHVLQEAGHEVVVVEAAKSVGQGTSYANGAQLSYSYVSPFASPEVFADLPRLMLSGHSPVRIRLRADLEQWRWLAAFIAACTPKRTLQATLKLLELAALSRAELNAFEAASHMDFEHRRTGKLVVYATERAYRAALRKLDAKSNGTAAATRQVAMRADECVALDPFLKRLQSRIHGAIFTPTDDTADCYAFCRALQVYITRPGASGSVQLNTHIDRIELQNGRAVAAIGGQQKIAGDAFVLANGIDAHLLGVAVGLNLRIYPLKGYSVTIDLPRNMPAPLVSVTEFERRTVFAPLGHRIRVAGIADLVGYSLSLNRRRISELMRYARELTDRDVSTADARPWAGLRPATPDGLPIVGATQVPGLFVNAGHGGFGFTLAMGCARLMQRALAGERTGFDLS
jgi:D-amino-acid dehydrogenase